MQRRVSNILKSLSPAHRGPPLEREQGPVMSTRRLLAPPPFSTLISLTRAHRPDYIFIPPSVIFNQSSSSFFFFFFESMERRGQFVLGEIIKISSSLEFQGSKFTIFFFQVSFFQLSLRPTFLFFLISPWSRFIQGFLLPLEFVLLCLILEVVDNRDEFRLNQ